MNLRSHNECGRDGLIDLTNKIGVYLVGFMRADVGHFVVARIRRSKGRIVIDESGTFPLDSNTWMDTLQHEIATA